MARRPLIGVTGPDRGGAAAWQATRAALLAVGGRAVRLTPTRDRDLSQLAGLVLGGGADVSAPTFEAAAGDLARAVAESHEAVSRGQTSWHTALVAPLTLLLRRLGAVQSAGELDPRRDHFESQLLDLAMSRHLPVLGICRGAQLLTVLAGGSLHQDIRPLLGEAPHIRSVLPRVPIDIEGDSRLAAWCGATRLTVNALHHQAIRTAGRGYRIVAKDHRGIVQAVEHSERPFVLGVQWHPEYVPQQPRQRAIFRALVQAAGTQR